MIMYPVYSSISRVTIYCFLIHDKGFPGDSDSKESACNAGDLGSIAGLGSLEKGKATHSSLLAWKISWTVYIVHGVAKSRT